MLLSGSSYFTRDLYRPLVDADLSEDREDLLGRVGVVVFATAALAASVWAEAGGLGADTVGSVLVDIGDLAFGGFAQLALPVIVALYWRRTTRTGLLAGLFVPQFLYVGFNVLPETTVAGVRLFAEAYLGWGISLYCMGVGLAVTVAVSAATARAPGEETAGYVERFRAD
jgi:SSS family solute:Na+ symporter